MWAHQFCFAFPFDDFCLFPIPTRGRVEALILTSQKKNLRNIWEALTLNWIDTFFRIENYVGQYLVTKLKGFNIYRQSGISKISNKKLKYLLDYLIIVGYINKLCTSAFSRKCIKYQGYGIEKSSWWQFSSSWFE